MNLFNGHRLGVYSKALHEQLFTHITHVLDGPNPVK